MQRMSVPPTPNGFGNTSITRCRKAVTPKKLAANRLNSTKSTGPRTEQGKRNSRFNAVTLGLFAKHIVIPICDDLASHDFQVLLDEIHLEFSPIGMFEEWLVVKIAEGMWRLRRASRCESGAVREAAMPITLRYVPEDILPFVTEIGLLAEAQKQINSSGTLTEEVYRHVLPLVEKTRHDAAETEERNRSFALEGNKQEFLMCISDRKKWLEAHYRSLCRMEDRASDIKFNYEALVPEADMERILRYEERVFRQIDWAINRLLETQERRRALTGGVG